MEKVKPLSAKLFEREIIMLVNSGIRGLEVNELNANILLRNTCYSALLLHQFFKCFYLARLQEARGNSLALLSK